MTAETVLAHDIGFDLAPKVDPLTLAVQGYLARYKGSTRKDYTTDLKVFLGWCERNELPPLLAKRAHIEFYLRWLEETGWASSTVARRYGVVNGLFKYAIRDELIDKNPCTFVDTPKVDKAAQRRTYLSALEFGIFLDAARKAGPTEHALTALIGLRGLRISEACRLNVETITHTHGYDTIHVVRKGGKAESIPLPAPVANAVRLAIGDRLEGPLLLNTWGKRLDRASATRMIRRVAVSAAVKTDISPHSFRRTFITTGLAMGIPLRDMQVAAGHANSTTTEVYDMSSKNPDRDASHRLASYVAGIAG